MIILASDTSTKTLSVAICRERTLVAGSTEQTGTTHCQTHMPVVLKLLTEAGLRFCDIDLYACTVGPGSYTGIRIGVSTTKAMAFAAGKKAIGVSTLETLARPHQAAGRMVCPILDARNRRVFSSGYLAADLGVPEANRSIEDFMEQISEVLKVAFAGENVPPDLVFCGDAASVFEADPKVKERMASLAKTGLVNTVSFLATVPEASDAADIARLKWTKACQADNANAGAGAGAGTGDPFALEANYLSPSQAERMKKTVAASGCSIRLASPDDLNSIYALEQECFTIPWSMQSLETDLTRNNEVATYLVAVEGGRVTGYIGMWMVLDEAQVTNLAVAEDARRKGTGQRLIQRLADIAKERGAVSLLLEVRESNIPARTVYERCGFVQIAVRKAYYENNGEDAIIMLKKF